MRELLFVLLTLVVLGAFEAVFYLRRFVKQRRVDEIRGRLRHLGDGRREGGLLRERRFASSPGLSSFIGSLPFADTAHALIEQSDSRLTVAQLLLYSSVGASGAGLGALLVRAGPLVAVMVALVAGAAPWLVLLMARDQRSRKLSEQLPDALDMMARALRAGNALSNSIQLVAAEMPEPLNVEFGRVYEEQRLGVSVERAVVNMTARVPKNADLRIVAVSLVVQKETGGNLAEILEKIAHTIRARYQFYGKVRALTAEGRASGMVLGSLPIGMLLFLLVFNGKYFRTALEDPMGHLILGFAFGSWVLGVLWLNQLTKVDY